ncbi:MAG: glycosyl transferase family 1, partial [Nitrospiraceae bacterium]
ERLRREWQIADGTFLIGMVGRFDPQKDHGNLIAALGRLRQRGMHFGCVLVGKDLVPDNPSISQQIAAHGLDENVRLLGQRTDIPAVMNALDVHVLPSAYGEAFPNVLAEAMACGTPCVTTDV